MPTIEEIKDRLFHADILYDEVKLVGEVILATGRHYLHYDQLQNIAQYNYFKGIRVHNNELAIEFMIS